MFHRILLLLIFFLIYHTSSTFAQTLTPSVNPTIHEKLKLRPTIRIAMQDKLKEFRQSQRDELKEKLEKLTDERKQELVLKLNERIATTNENKTSRMSKALVNLQTSLEKIKTKATNAKNLGKDTTLLDASIADAEKAILIATKTVTTQSEKIYTITLTNEKNLKADVGEVVKQLQADLRATHKTVIDAKKSVKLAASNLRKI